MHLTTTYGLTHFALGVRDLTRTKKFYSAVFEMKSMYDEKGFVQMTTPGCHDILVFEQREDSLIGSSGGIAHFGFRLRAPGDILAIRQKIIDAGAEIVDEGEFVAGSPYIFFKDPDGYNVEVWYELLP
jgi:catechol-2,3-dioxygenase